MPAATRCPLGPWPHTHPVIIYHPAALGECPLEPLRFFPPWGEAVKLHFSLPLGRFPWELQVPTGAALGRGGDQDCCVWEQAS